MWPSHLFCRLLKPGTHWQQSRFQPGRLCWTGNKVERSTLLPICWRFNKVDRVEFNFVGRVYRALQCPLFLFLSQPSAESFKMFYAQYTVLSSYASISTFHMPYFVKYQLIIASNYSSVDYSSNIKHIKHQHYELREATHHFCCYTQDRQGLGWLSDDGKMPQMPFLPSYVSTARHLH